MQPQGPTPSQPTNELFQLLADVAEGRRMAAEVEEVRSARRARVELILQDFRRRSQGQAPHETQQVEAAFEAHFAALEQVAEALALPERPRVEQAARQLAETACEVDRALRAFDWADMTSGETPYPLLNLLRRLRDTLGQPGHPRAQEMVAWSRPVLEQATRTTASDARLAPLAAAFERAVQALEAGGTNLFPEIVGACSQLETALLEEPAAAPPPSSWLEAVLISGRAYSEGEMPEEMVTEALDALEDRLVVAYQEFENAVLENATSGQRVQEEVTRSRDLFARLNEILEAIRADLQTCADLPRLLDSLEEIGRALHEAQRFFDETESQAGQFPCPRCGQLNLPGSRVCSACAAQLPRLELTPAPTELPTSQDLHSQNMFEIAQAAEKAATGAISSEQFAGYLRWGFELAQRGREALDRIPPETMQNDEARALAEQTREGINEIQTGLEELTSWTRGLGQDFYRAGTRRILRGGQKLVAVQKAAD